MKVAHLDYEFRSGVSINDVGSHRASIDPRFEILCAAVSRDDDPSERVYLWVNPLFICPDMPGTDNAEAERILAEADLIYAHNAPNEQANTWGALQQGKHCPLKKEPPLTIWRCTAAMARKAGLPNALEDLCEALNVHDPKDRAGKALIKFFCEPDEKTGEFRDPKAHPDKWVAFGKYCVQDVHAETACGNKLKPFELSGAALETFQFDLRMNQRGIPINVKAARYAQRIIDNVQQGVTAEFRKITGLNPTQRDKFIKWMAANTGLELPNTQAATIDALITGLEKEVNDSTICIHVRTRLEKQLHLLSLYQKVSYAAVKKIQTMLDCVCPDGRVRGAHMYYGAGTGRWSGKLLQPQNFKKTPKWMRDVTDEVYRHICRGVSAEYLDRIYGDPLELISGCIRHFIHHDCEILDGDYSAVEARIICWLAGQDDILEKWRKGEDLYKWMASHVYNIPIEQVDADQREVGKRIILGCGFQMGWKKFQSSCRIQYQLELPDEICQRGVKLFRSLCKKITSYWYLLNDRAKEAVKTGGESGPFRMRTIGGIKFLLFKLRSGRSLAYPHPKIELVPYVPEKVYDEFGEEEPQEMQFRENITYWGQIPGSGQWGRIKLYGGKLAENETQATAADFMAHGAINAERKGMAPFMLVHDQGLALRTNGQTAKDFEAALGDMPAWARGFPMKVEAKITAYYKK